MRLSKYMNHNGNVELKRNSKLEVIKEQKVEQQIVKVISCIFKVNDDLRQDILAL